MRRWTAAFWSCARLLGWRPKSRQATPGDAGEFRVAGHVGTLGDAASEPKGARSSGLERRAAIRHPSDLHTSCRRITGAKDEVWEASVGNVSTSGVGLFMDRSFQPGTILAFQLDRPEQEFSRTVLGRVVHSSPRPGGKWLVGCLIATELSDDELHAFRARRERPEESDGRAWMRFPCEEGSPRYTVLHLDNEQLPAKIVNIAPGGFGLLVPRPLECGTPFRVELRTAPDSPGRLLSARAAHVTEQPGEGWVIGCAFTDQLGDDELRRLLA